MELHFARCAAVCTGCRQNRRRPRYSMLADLSINTLKTQGVLQRCAVGDGDGWCSSLSTPNNDWNGGEGESMPLNTPSTNTDSADARQSGKHGSKQRPSKQARP